MSINGNAPDIARLVKDFPPRREMTEQGELQRSLPVRLSLRRHSDFADTPYDITGEVVLGEQARFFPTNAALASWMAQADAGAAHIVYE